MRVGNPGGMYCRRRRGGKKKTSITAMIEKVSVETKTAKPISCLVLLIVATLLAVYLSSTNNSASTTIDRILSEMALAPNEVEPEVMRKWEKEWVTLFEEECSNTMTFQMDTHSTQTLEAHLSYLLTSLSNKEHIPYLNPESTIITKQGTLVDQNDPTNKDSEGARCSLVTELLKKAEDLGIMSQTFTSYHSESSKSEDDFFSMSNEDVWLAVEHRFTGKDSHESAFELISLAKEGGHTLHWAQQISPQLVSRFCPNIYQWFDEKEEVSLSDQNEEARDDDVDPRSTMLIVISVLLRQIHHNGNMHWAKNEVPALDRKGYLMAVDRYKIDERGHKFSDYWTTCSFIDHIVYYRNVVMEEQCRFLIESARNHHYLAFDMQAEMMMIEHCPKAKEMMSSEDQSIRFMDTYRSAFRADLLQFVLHIAENNFVGDAASFVVTESGKIMHRDWAHRNQLKYIECTFIQHIAALGRKGRNGEKFDENKYNPRSHAERLYMLEMAADAKTQNIEDELMRGNGEKFDENRLNPRFHEERFDELEKEFEEKKQKIKQIAKLMENLAWNEDIVGLRQMIIKTIYHFHGEEMSALVEDVVDDLLAEILQYIAVLTHVEWSEWPVDHDHVASIDFIRGKMRFAWMDELARDPNMLDSDAFAQIFKYMKEIIKTDDL